MSYYNVYNILLFKSKQNYNKDYTPLQFNQAFF
jgi:hypothetical protein